MRFRIKMISVQVGLGLFLSQSIYAGGVAGGGGGKKEILFNEVAENIASWLRSNRSDQIGQYLPSHVTLDEYKSKMLRVLAKYNSTFTDDKVFVNGYEKTCRSYVDSQGLNQILCNNSQFGLDTIENINEIYRQVHHEFAALACEKTQGGEVCLEQNNNEKSDYRISDHLSGFLVEEIVKRLPINDSPSIQSVDCSLETHLKVFRKYFGALKDVNDFSGRIVPNRQNNTSTLYLSFTYWNQKNVGRIVLNGKDCSEIDHGTVPLETSLKVFN